MQHAQAMGWFDKVIIIIRSSGSGSGVAHVVRDTLDSQQFLYDVLRMV